MEFHKLKHEKLIGKKEKKEEDKDESEPEEEGKKDKSIIRFHGIVNSMKKEYTNVGVCFFSKYSLVDETPVGIIKNKLNFLHVEVFFEPWVFLEEKHSEEEEEEIPKEHNWATGIMMDDTHVDEFGREWKGPGTLFVKWRTYSAAVRSYCKTHAETPEDIRIVEFDKPMSERLKGPNHYTPVYFSIESSKVEEVKPWILSQEGKHYDIWGYRKMLFWPETYKYEPDTWYCVNYSVVLLQKLGILGEDVDPNCLTTDTLYKWLVLHPKRHYFGILNSEMKGFENFAKQDV